jgi:hypothetical protein
MFCRQIPSWNRRRDARRCSRSSPRVDAAEPIRLGAGESPVLARRSIRTIPFAAGDKRQPCRRKGGGLDAPVSPVARVRFVISTEAKPSGEIPARSATGGVGSNQASLRDRRVRDAGYSQVPVGGQRCCMRHVLRTGISRQARNDRRCLWNSVGDKLQSYKPRLPRTSPGQGSIRDRP